MKVGDVVCLKFGPHFAMCISGIDHSERSITCMWFDRYHFLHTGNFWGRNLRLFKYDEDEISVVVPPDVLSAVRSYNGIQS